MEREKNLTILTTPQQQVAVLDFAKLLAPCRDAPVIGGFIPRRLAQKPSSTR